MPRVSTYFKLRKNQPELDFVDVRLDRDTPLFVDPYALGKRQDIWSIEASNLVVDFFQKAIDAIRQGDDKYAQDILSHLNEPNETRLGLSKGKPRGRGVSGKQSTYLYKALKGSSAAKTGFLKDLEDCELLVDGIGRDKISDITTNIIRQKLVEYTSDQCVLLAIPTERITTGRYWDSFHKAWSPGDYADLPEYSAQRILLVPKAIVTYDLEFSYQHYYAQFVLKYLQAEHLNANSSLVELLKNGKRRVTKKNLKRENPCTKAFLYEFSRKHPDVLAEYKMKHRDLGELADKDFESAVGTELTELLPLGKALKKIQVGTAHADDYHNLILGVMEAIFYPWLVYPKKEQPIHEGRKRIDIAFSNAAKDGFFSWLHAIKKIQCPFVFFECKNYKADPTNPELDQLAGRFSVQRGRFGFLVCRSCKDKVVFRKRCRDTALDDRGWIILLTDDDVLDLLRLKVSGASSEIHKLLDEHMRQLVM